MAGHAVASGSAVGGILEGFLSGVHQGADLRNRRTQGQRQRVQDQQLAEEIQRRREAEEAAVRRQATLDALDVEARRISQGVTDLEVRERHGVSIFPDAEAQEPQRPAPHRFEAHGGFANVNRLRRDVADGLGAGGPALPPGFSDVPGGSQQEREAESRLDLGRVVGRILGPDGDLSTASPEDFALLDEAGVLDDLISRGGRGGGDPNLQRFTVGGKEFLLHPDTGEITEATFEGRALTSADSDRDEAQGLALRRSMDRIDQGMRARERDFDDTPEEQAAMRDELAVGEGFSDFATISRLVRERNQELFPSGGGDAGGDAGGGLDDVVLSLAGRSEAWIRENLPQVIEGGERKYSDEDIDQIVAAVTGGR